MPTPSSLQIFGPLVLADGWQSFAPFMTGTSSFSCTFKFNSFGAPYGGLFVSGVDSGTPNGLGNPTIAGVNLDVQSIEFKWGPGLIYTYRTMQLGTSHFLAMTNNAAGVSKCWLDGNLVASGSFGSTGWQWANAQIAIGIFGSASGCNIQLQDLAMSATYIWQDADIPQLFNQSKTAIQIDPSFSYWPLSGTIGATPVIGDFGLNDQNARASNFVVVYLGSLANARYAAPLSFSAPTIVTAQVTKSGGLTAFVALGGGDGLPRQITSITQTPTINVQFGGSGAFHPIQTWGPLADIPDPNGGDHTWAHCVLQNVCGGVKHVVVQNPGHGYSSSPVATGIASGGVAPTFGTPVVTGGVTSFSGISDSGGHGSAPAVTITGNGWGAQADAVLTGSTVTGLNVFWPGYGYTTASASWSGGSATAHVTNCIRSISVITPGSANTGIITINITDSTGSGAIAVPAMTGIVPGDVVTWGGVTSGWLVATSGNAAATVSASVENCSGRFETGLAGTPDFGSPPAGTLAVGWNQINFDGDFRAVSSATTPSWIKHVQIQQPSTADSGGRPILITANAGTPFTLGFKYSTTSNGVWTLVADELNPSSPLSVLLGCNGSYATVATSIVAAGTSTTGVVSVTQGAMGSGYTDRPFVTPSGGSPSTPATFACRINSAGQVIGTWLVSPGVGYGSTPTLVYTSVDGNGSGAASTCTTGSIISGKTWQLTVSGIPAKADLADSTASVDLRLLIWNSTISSGTSLNCPYTLCNEFLFSPKETASVAPSYPSRTPKMRPSADMIEWLQSLSGNGPGLLRWMNALYYGLGNSTVEAEDLKNFDDWWWFTPTNLGYTLQPTGPRTITVVTMRTWRTSSSQTFPWSTPWVSPNIYTNQWGSPNPTWSGYGASGDTSGPFQINLDAIGANQGCLNYGGSPGTNLYCVECVTAVPHNLKFGQLMQVQGGATGTFNIGLDLSGHVDTHNSGDFTGLWFVPTGPTTFVSVAIGVNKGSFGDQALNFPGGIYHVAGSFSVSVQYQVSGFLNFADAPEGAAAGNGYFHNSAMHLCIPYMATDACVKAIGRRVRDQMPVGSRVYTELGDENWNVGGQPWQGFFSWMAGALQLYAPRYLNQNEAFAMRSVQVGQIVRDVYNEIGRGSEVRTIVAGQFSNGFSAMIPTIVASGLECDAFSVAPYDQVPFNFPNTPGVNLATANASCFSHWPSSIAYLWPTPWSPEMWFDNWRYGLQYDTEIRRRFKVATDSLATYTGPGSPCELEGYEGGFTYEISYNIASRLDPDGSNLSKTAIYDFQYQPAMYDALWTYFHSLERGGVSKIAILYLADNTGLNAQTIWPNVGWQGQPAGKGDGSLCRDGSHIVNLFWADTQQDQTSTNANPRLQAHQDWQDAISGAPATMATLSGPATGTVGIATSNFTVTLNGVYTGTVTPAVSGVSGSFSPSSLVWSASSIVKTFTFTASSAGTALISISASPILTISGSPKSVVITAVATTVTLTGPTTGTIGVVSANFTATVNGAYTGTVTPSVTGGGVLTPGTLTWTNTSDAKTFTYTPASAGTKSVSIAASPVLSIVGSPISVVVPSSAATTATLSGPSSGAVGSPTSNFTVTLDGVYSGTVTPAATGGGTFSPGLLTWAGTSVSQTFTYTASSVGTKSISITASPVLSYSGSPISVTISSGFRPPVTATTPNTQCFNLRAFDKVAFDGSIISQSIATTATLSGPSLGTVGIPTANFTVAVDGIYTGTITPSVSSGGSFSPAVLVWNGTLDAKTFTYTATSAGTQLIFINAVPRLNYSGSPLSIGIRPIAATTAALSGPSTGIIGVPTSAFTIALNGAYTGVITPSVNGVTGTFNPLSLIWANTSNSQTFTFTASSAGIASISISANPALSTIGSPEAVSISAFATSATLTGPSAGTVEVNTQAFTVTLNGIYTGTITPVLANITGSFTPAVLTWNGTSQSQTFTFKPTHRGLGRINLVSRPSIFILGVPILIHVLPHVTSDARQVSIIA